MKGMRYWILIQNLGAIDFGTRTTLIVSQLTLINIPSNDFPKRYKNLPIVFFS